MKKINKKIVRRLVCVASALVLSGGASAYYINKSQQKLSLRSAPLKMISR